MPVAGREKVTKLLLGLQRKGAAWVKHIEMATINGLPGIVTFDEAGVSNAIALEIVEGRIAAFYVVRNPEKLGAVASHLSQ